MSAKSPIIRQLESVDLETWDGLAGQYGSIFDTVLWTDLFGESLIKYGIFDRGGSLIGGFCIYAEKKFGLSIYRNPPFTPSIGPFVKISSSNPVAIMDEWKKLLSLVADFIEEKSFSMVMCSLDKKIIDMQPFIWKRFKVVPNYTYILDLSDSCEKIWDRMSGERRKNVNKGTKDGLITRSIDDFGVIKSLVMKSFTRQGKCPYEHFLDRILFDFAATDNSFAFATFAGDVPIASVFCVYDRNSAYYLAGGYDSERKHHGAGAMAMWEAIKLAKNLGLRFFDFEGSMSPDIEKYFRGFGGTLTPYYQINKAKLPLEFILKLYKREFF